MKCYRIYVDGVEIKNRLIKAKGHNEAEKKAKELYPVEPSYRVSVEYTEV